MAVLEGLLAKTEGENQQVLAQRDLEVAQVMRLVEYAVCFGAPGSLNNAARMDSWLITAKLPFLALF